MAKPLHAYTVAEASNLQVYQNYSSQTLTIDDNDTAHYATSWPGGDGQAKEVTIIPISGDAANVIKLALKIQGTWGDNITLHFDDFPITINNILIDQIRMESSAGSSTSEVFEILSFH
jgi:hypothetical protein